MLTGDARIVCIASPRLDLRRRRHSRAASSRTAVVAITLTQDSHHPCPPETPYVPSTPGTRPPPPTTPEATVTTATATASTTAEMTPMTPTGHQQKVHASASAPRSSSRAPVAGGRRRRRGSRPHHGQTSRSTPTEGEATPLCSGATGTRRRKRRPCPQGVGSVPSGVASGRVLGRARATAVIAAFIGTTVAAAAAAARSGRIGRSPWEGSRCRGPPRPSWRPRFASPPEPRRPLLPQAAAAAAG